MDNKLSYQDPHTFIEYDPSTKLISVSRGHAHHYQLCALIFDVETKLITYEVLRDIAVNKTVGLTISRHW